MRVSDIIGNARSQFLDDARTLYEWSNIYLAQCATQAEREAAKRAKLITDRTTQSATILRKSTATSTLVNKLADSGAAFDSTYLGMTVYNMADNKFATITAIDSGTQLSLSSDIMVSGKAYVVGDASKAIATIGVISGQSDYSISTKVIKIKSMKLSSSPYPMKQVTEGWLDRNYYNWKAAKGIPRYYVEEKGVITLVPQPDSTLNLGTGRDILSLSVYRLPLKDLSTSTTGPVALTFTAATKTISRSSGSFITDGFTSGTTVITDASLNPGQFTLNTVTALTVTVLETVVNEGPVTKTMTAVDAEPEIPEEYHFNLVYWICYLAYTKQDADALDLGKARWHEAEFASKFGNPVSSHVEGILRSLPSNFELEHHSF